MINTNKQSEFWETCLHENWEPQVDDGKESTLNTQWPNLYGLESNACALSSCFFFIHKKCTGSNGRIKLQRICLGYVFVYKCCKYLKYIYFLQNLFSHVTNKTSLWVLRAIFCSCNSYKPRVQWTNVFTQGLLSFVLSFLYKLPVYCKAFVSATHRLSVWTKKGTLLSCHA